MDCLEEVRKFMVENFLFGEEDKVKEDTPFLESGIVDSTGILELVAFLEEKFGICVEDDELVPENLNSLHNVGNYIIRKLAAKTTT